jgi:hypothetical protein
VTELVLRWLELREQRPVVTAEEVCAGCPERLDEVRQRLTELGALEAFLRTRADERRPESSTMSETCPLPGSPGRTAPGPGATIPGYELLGEVGHGGMGVVYRAVQVRLKRTVALKMILGGAYAGSRQVARFRAEAEAVARLQSPNIVQVYEVGEHAGRHFIALEFVEGGTLAQRLHNQPLPPREAAELVQALARAVHYAHQRGVVHRDLKPANVLLTPEGTPKVTDFGLAKSLTEDAGGTQTGAILGTPSYMAPEQAAGLVHHVGPATDVYSLGAILYEALTGRPPHKAASVIDTLEQVRSQEPVPPARLQPKLPRSLETICLKCLEKEPAKRYASADALAEDLRRFLGDEPIRARPPGLVTRFRLWCRRPERVRDAGAFMVFLGVVLTLWCFSGVAFLAAGILRPDDTRAALVQMTAFVFAFYLPMAGVGLGTMARRRNWLWAGVAVSAIDLVVAVCNMIGSNPVADLLDVGGLLKEPHFRYPVFSLLAILMGFQLFGYCVALVAYHANRKILR